MIFGTPPIVTNGLVLHLDAGSRQSYVSGSTTWRDLSGNGNNFTLVNNPIFSNINQGSLVFNGTNQYGFINKNLFADNISAVTVQSFCQEAVSGNNVIYMRSGNSGGQWSMVVRPATQGSGIVTGGNVALNVSAIVAYNGLWLLSTYTYINNTSKTLNYNGGIVRGTTSITNANLRTATSPNDQIGAFTAGSQYFSGSISDIKIYNRALSAAEVAQNYNALKTRFGLT